MNKEQRRAAAPEIAGFIDGLREWAPKTEITFARIAEYRHGRSWDQLDAADTPAPAQE